MVCWFAVQTMDAFSAPSLATLGRLHFIFSLWLLYPRTADLAAIHHALLGAQRHSGIGARQLRREYIRNVNRNELS